MSGWLDRLNKEYCGGVLMSAIGLSVASQGATYEVGTLSHMGPGFFPVTLGVMLTLTGLLIILAAFLRPGLQKSETLRPEWKGWICIGASIVAFVILGAYGGLLPATFAIVFIAALGDRLNTFRSAFVLAAGMVGIGVVVFWWGLQIQLPLLRWG